MRMKVPKPASVHPYQLRKRIMGRIPRVVSLNIWLSVELEGWWRSRLLCIVLPKHFQLVKLYFDIF